MKCKFCNETMKKTGFLENYKFSVYNCKCNASCVIMNENSSKEIIWHDGKPPRAICINDYLNFKKDNEYTITDADYYQVKVKIEDDEMWIDKDNINFMIYM